MPVAPGRGACVLVHRNTHTLTAGLGPETLKPGHNQKHKMLKNRSPGPAPWLLLPSDSAFRGQPSPRHGLSSSPLMAEGSCPAAEADSVTEPRASPELCVLTSAPPSAAGRGTQRLNPNTSNHNTKNKMLLPILRSP